jgi:hypothetical protein
MHRPFFWKLVKPISELTDAEWKVLEKAYEADLYDQHVREHFEEQYCKDNGITDIRGWRRENLRKALDRYEPLDNCDSPSSNIELDP